MSNHCRPVEQLIVSSSVTNIVYEITCMYAISEPNPPPTTFAGGTERSGLVTGNFVINLGLAGMCAHHLVIILMSTRVYGDLRFMKKEGENEASGDEFETES